MEAVLMKSDAQLPLRGYETVGLSSLDFFEAMIQFCLTQGMAEEDKLRRLFLVMSKMPAVRPGHLPCLIIPGIPTSADWDRMIPLIQSSGKSCRNGLKGWDLVDIAEIPQEPYLLIDVDDGRGTFHLGQSEAEEMLRSQGRQGLTAWEALFFSLMFSILEYHSIYAVASRVRKVGEEREFYPTIYRHQDGPILAPVGDGLALPHYGTPSCRERRTA